MEIIYVILGILVFVGLTIIIPMLFSKLFNSNIGYRGGTVATADDLDGIASSLRNKVDLNYAKKKSAEERFLNDIEPINKKISSIFFKQSAIIGAELQLHARILNVSEEEAEQILKKKYNSQLKELYEEKLKLKEKYEEISGYPMPKV